MYQFREALVWIVCILFFAVVPFAKRDCSVFSRSIWAPAIHALTLLPGLRFSALLSGWDRGRAGCVPHLLRGLQSLPAAAGAGTCRLYVGALCQAEGVPSKLAESVYRVGW